MEFLWKFIEAQGAWAFTLSGFVIILCIAGIVWLSRRSIRISDVRIAQLEKQVQQSLNSVRLELGDVRMELVECETNSMNDQGYANAARGLATEYRALYIHTVGGRREASPELAQIDARRDELIRQIHTDRTMRVIRMKEKTAKLEQLLTEEEPT